jgi:hypothetical protein
MGGESTAPRHSRSEPVAVANRSSSVSLYSLFSRMIVGAAKVATCGQVAMSTSAHGRSVAAASERLHRVGVAADINGSTILTSCAVPVTASFLQNNNMDGRGLFKWTNSEQYLGSAKWLHADAMRVRRVRCCSRAMILSRSMV